MHSIDQSDNDMIGSVNTLAGNRVRLQQLPLDRYTRSAEELPVPSILLPASDALNLLLECMQCKRTEDVVDRACQELEIRDYSGSHDARVLGDLCFKWLDRDDEEVNFLPLRRVYKRLITEESHRPFRAFLTAIANRYVRATSYLFPFLDAFTRAALRCATNVEAKTVDLFLRDAIFCYPSLFAHERARPLRFVKYTRADRKSKSPPTVFGLNGNGIDIVNEGFSGAFLVDVGLYGTLIASLIEDGHWQPDTSLLFMGSRNPWIAGWLNFEFGAHALRGADIDARDLVRLTDTVESLVKPFRMPLDEASAKRGPMPYFELAEPITLVCSLAFVSAMHMYVRNSPIASFEQCLTGLEAAKADTSGWFLHPIIPPWDGGRDFARDWRHGPIQPMIHLWGYSM
jgi:hypothetical protein